MKIILNLHEGADRADLIDMVRAADFAFSKGFADKAPGQVMLVSMGEDLRKTFGVVRRKGCVSVYPPNKPEDPSASTT